jgi:hypothetical protein
VNGDVGKITQHGVHLVVLPIGGVEMSTCELIGTIVAQYAGEHVQRKRVWVLESWHFEEHTHIEVGEFVVSHGHDGWREVGLLGISNCSGH